MVKKRLKLSALFFVLIAISVNCKTPQSQKLTKADMSILRGNTDKLVIVYSRTGNTAEMGKTISGIMNTDYIRLDADKSQSDYYTSAPNRNEVVSFRPKSVNLSKYRILFLGSPIWWWHPTAYIYSFIKKHDLDGKKVVLFYTYRGGLSSEAIANWEKLVSSKKGKVIDVTGINCKKLEGETVKRATIKIIKKRKAKWSI